MELIRHRIAEYYGYTNGRIKPEDIHEICIYKREIESCAKEIRDAFRKSKQYVCSKLKWDNKDIQRENVTEEPV